MCVYMYVCIYIYRHTHIYTHFIYTYILTIVIIHAYLRTYIHKYVLTYIHTLYLHVYTVKLAVGSSHCSTNIRIYMHAYIHKLFTCIYRQIDHRDKPLLHKHCNCHDCTCFRVFYSCQTRKNPACMYVCMYMCIYIYICDKRERTLFLYQVCTYLSIYVYSKYIRLHTWTHSKRHKSYAIVRIGMHAQCLCMWWYSCAFLE